MTEITVRHETPPTLEEAQRIVGGYVTLIHLRDGTQMLVDEEGLVKGLPPNIHASRMAGQLVVGPVLILAAAARWVE